jgi:exopolyphosphatase / guanosine-5'-triphosphate,3'-diphosphate pyrophosphatase
VTRIGVVDVGTNSTRLLIADVGPGGEVRELDRRSVVTRLGEGVDATGRLADAAMGRVRGVLASYRECLDALDAERAVAVLTSAVRDAANGPQFEEEVRERFGLDAAVLGGDEEARLTFLGATSERDPDDPATTAVIDIGGGSTEFVVGRGRTAAFHVSTQVGVVRQTERHLASDPPARDELDAVARDARDAFLAGLPEDVRAGVHRAIAVAGTGTHLAAIDLELEPYDSERVEGHVLSARRVQELLERLAALPLAQRREVRGLHPDRAPTIVAGAVLLREGMAALGLDAVEVSEHDLLRGAALNAAQTAGSG